MRTPRQIEKRERKRREPRIVSDFDKRDYMIIFIAMIFYIIMKVCVL